MTFDVLDISTRQRSQSRHVPAGSAVVRTMNEILNKGKLGRVRADSGILAGRWDTDLYGMVKRFPIVVRFCHKFMFMCTQT